MINFKKALLGIGIVLAIGSASALWAIAPSTVSQVGVNIAKTLLANGDRQTLSLEMS